MITKHYFARCDPFIMHLGMSVLAEQRLIKNTARCYVGTGMQTYKRNSIGMDRLLQSLPCKIVHLPFPVFDGKVLDRIRKHGERAMQTIIH